jgi:FkbM family methyltransferase
MGILFPVTLIDKSSSLLDLPIILAGTGGAAWWVLEGFAREKISVSAFIVSNIKYESEETCVGLPVWKANSWNSLPIRQDKYLVVVSVMNPNVDIEKMKNELIEKGWRNTIDFTEYARLLLKEKAINICMLETKELQTHRSEITSLRNNLSDEKSKLTLDGFCSYVQSLNGEEFPKISKLPYFPNDVPRWDTNLKILDCGAYDGDTIRQAAECGYEIEQSFCFEPDFNSFNKLKNNLKDYKKVICLPIGVSEATAVKSFDSHFSTGSKIVEKGNSFVQCISLDDFMSDYRPNLIKMDIEGGELSALKGAQRMIREYRPNLAISVYHKSNDIWQIPNLIFDLLGSCKLYLRKHSRTIADTVLYVFP